MKDEKLLSDLVWNAKRSGALIVGGNVTQRFLVDLGNGSRTFLSYLYGPRRSIGLPWADHEPTVRQWARLLRWAGKCEQDILAAKRRPCDAAILVDNAAEINTAYVNAGFHKYPLFDRAGIYVALMDSHVPVEIVGAEEILEDGLLANYRALYASDPHVHVRVQEQIRKWVADGGVLWAAGAAFARQEYDEPCRTMDEVFGLARRPPVGPAPTQWDPDEAEEILVPQNDLLPEMRIKTVPFKPRYELSTGKSLAHFSDGTPAIIENRYGKGRAFLVACPAHLLAGDHGHAAAEPPGAARVRRIVTLGARVAGVRPHVRLSHPRVLWFVHDGPRQTVLFLVNCFESKLHDLTVEVHLPKRPASGCSRRTDTVNLEWLGDRVRFKIDLERQDGEIIVFRH